MNQRSERMTHTIQWLLERQEWLLSVPTENIFIHFTDVRPSLRAGFLEAWHDEYLISAFEYTEDDVIALLDPSYLDLE